MSNKIIILMISFLLLISSVSAEGTSIILENDQTTDITGSAIIMCSLVIVIFAAMIIIKILISRGE